MHAEMLLPEIPCSVILNARGRLAAGDWLVLNSGHAVAAPHQQLDGAGGGGQSPVGDGGHVQMVGLQRAAAADGPSSGHVDQGGLSAAFTVTEPMRSSTSHPTFRYMVWPLDRVTRV